MEVEAIDKVDIVFENCDFVSIPLGENQDLLFFNLSEINETCGVTNLSNSLLTCRIANAVHLVFSSECLKLSSFWGEKDGCGNILENQLKFRDITAVHIYCRGNKEYEYCVLYEEENEGELGSPNINQKNIWLEDGSCRVEIGKAKGKQM